MCFSATAWRHPSRSLKSGGFSPAFSFIDGHLQNGALLSKRSQPGKSGSPED
jgi:hypothetical protein